MRIERTPTYLRIFIGRHYVTWCYRMARNTATHCTICRLPFVRLKPSRRLNVCGDCLADIEATTAALTAGVYR